MSVLYTCSNINHSTVRLVANSIRNLTMESDEVSIRKVVIFYSLEKPEDNIANQIEVYKEILGSQIRIEQVPLSNSQLAASEDLVAVFNDKSQKYVDLTNGQKITTAKLYMAASLLRLENMYYASLKVKPQEIPDVPLMGKHYEYIKLPAFTDISNLSKLGYFDLIFYLEEIEKIFCEVHQSFFLEKMSFDLRESVVSSFQRNNFRSAVSSATTGSEPLIKYLLAFLEEYPKAQEFSNQFGIKLGEYKDPLGEISYFFKQYSLKTNTQKKYIDKNLEAIVTLPSLLTPLRNFRNLSAHSGVSSHLFQANEARVCINLAVEVFRCAKSSQEFGKKLKLLERR